MFGRIQLGFGKIMEAKSPTPDEFDVVIIESGKSLNGVVFPDDTLKNAKDKFQYAKCFAYEFLGKVFDHLPDDVKRRFPQGFAKNFVGYFKNPRFTEFRKPDGSIVRGIVATFKVTADWLKKTISSIVEDGINALNNMFGFSIDAYGDTERTSEGIVCKSLDDINSVDLVTYPAAGGRFLRVATSVLFKIQVKESKMDKLYYLVKGFSGEEIGDTHAKLFLSAIGESVEDFDQADMDAIKSAISECISQLSNVEHCKEILQALVNLIEEKKKKKKGYPEYPNYPDYPKPDKESTDDDVRQKLSELESLIKDMRLKEYLESALSKTKLSSASKEVVMAGKYNSTEEIDKKIDELVRIEASFKQDWGFSPRVEITESEGESLYKMLDDVIEGKASLKEAYIKFTGDSKITGEISSCHQKGQRRMTESLSSSDFPVALRDAIHRAVLKEYAMPKLQEWKLVVSDIVPLTDFKEYKWIKTSGYDELPEVKERENYPEVGTSGTEEAVTLKATKRGLIETVTIEMIRNDDLLALRRIPVKLARAAALTLHKAIFNGIFVSNPTYADGTSLFHANHNNLLASNAISASGFMSVKRAMSSQKAYGTTSDPLGLYPKWLVIPEGLEDTAFKLCNSTVFVKATDENATTPNIIAKKYGTDYIIVSYWDIASTTWYAVCDPKDCPTIIVGFLDGNENPRVLRADNPESGSMFYADKIAYRVDHVWGVTVADYRGMVKSTA